MRISAFYVNNFRSIQARRGKKILLEDFTVLIGPNNEGKSNFLDALAQSLMFLSGYFDFESRKRRFRTERDAPVSSSVKETIYKIEFSLTGKEQKEFKHATGISLKTNLIAEIRIPHATYIHVHDPSIKFKKQGVGGQLNKSRQKISQFLRQKLRLQYIPAHRTSETCLKEIEILLRRQIAILEGDKEYMDALDLIARKQKAQMKKLGEDVVKTLKQFIPSINSIEIFNEENFERTMRDTSLVKVDDGEKTDLKMKGSGVQSLTNISLVYHSANSVFAGSSLVFLIDEPEAHLHPSSIAYLKSVLHEMSRKHQVIIASHSPLLVNRSSVAANIIINDHEAKSAKSFREIREILGTKLSDNLINADTVIFVEGTLDLLLFKKWTSFISPKIDIALKGGLLTFFPLGGVTFLAQWSQLFKHNLCSVFAYLDNDKKAQDSVNNVIKQSIIDHNEYALLPLNGLKEAELEDFILPDVYRAEISSKFGLDLTKSAFSSDKKWSLRIRDLMTQEGKVPNDTTIEQIKSFVCEIASKADGVNALSSAGHESVLSLVKEIEKRLK